MTIINAVTGAGADPQLVSIDNAVTEFPQTFSPPTGYDGLSSVTVQAPANFKASNIKKDVEIAGVTGTYETEFNKQTKTTQATAFPTVLEPDTGYDGLSKAVVTAPDNLTAENIKKGVSIAEVEGTYDPQPNLQEKSEKATTFPVVIEPDADYDGLSKATVTTPDNLEASNIKNGVEIAGITGTYEPALNDLTVAEGGYTWDDVGSPMVIEPSTGEDGFKKVTLRKPDNLASGVIKKDITIAGITGTYEPQPKVQRKKTQATAFPTVVDVDDGYDGMTEVTVTAPDNLEASNIKDGVKIAGVTGTYGKTQEKWFKIRDMAFNPNSAGYGTITIAPDTGISGLSGVTISNGPTTTESTPLRPENIKKGVNILGYVGTYEPPLSTKDVTPTEFPTVVTEEAEYYYGMKQVTVEAPANLTAGNIKKDVEIAGVVGTYDPQPKLQTKETQATAFPTVIDVDSGYDGMTQATVTAPDNLTAENIKKDVTIAGVTGSYELTTETRDITSYDWSTGSSIEITPVEANAMSLVTLDIPANLSADNIRNNVTIAGVKGTFGPTETRKVQATGFPMLILPSMAGGLKSVTITAPDNLTASNIKKGVTIAEVEGTYEPTLQTTYAVPTAFPTTYTPTTGFDGIASIEIRKPTNLEAEYIKKDVTIAGVTGTYEVSGSNAMGLYLTNQPFELTEDSWSGVTGTVTKALSSTNVTSAVIGEGITTLAGYMFSGCKSLTTVQLPSTLTALPDGCFQNSTVTSVNIPDGIVNISTSCFYNCSNLTEIDIPDTVAILYSYAFNNCTGLKTITVRTQTPPTVQSLALTGLSSLTTIYVPSGRGNVYKAASGWSNYSAKIVEGDF